MRRAPRVLCACVVVPRDRTAALARPPVRLTALPCKRARSRLAMIGMVSFLIGHNLPGAVPALTSAF